MALRSLVRKMPALGLRSPAGPLMGPVHAPSPSPVAASRRMLLSNSRPDPSPRLNELYEKLDQANAMEAKVYKETRAVIQNGWDKLEKQSKALAYGLHALSAFVLLEACIMKCA